MADPSDNWSQRPSSVYTLLPSMLQSRIPKLPFLRRSASVGTAKSFYCSARNRQRGVNNTRCVSAHPPSPDQGSSTSSTTDRCLPSNSDAEDNDSIDNDPFSLSDRPSPKLIASSVSVEVHLDNGILWRYANQGLSLLMRSFQECGGVAGTIDSSSRFFSRQLYIHALTYLLRGLPEDLTSEEQMSICSALPKSIAKSNQIIMYSSDTSESQSSSERPVAQAYNIRPSVLHRILANCIIQSFLLIQLVLPYLRLIAYSAYRFERENRVSERLFSSTINTIDEIGKRSLRYTDAVCKLDDGRVGEALTDFASWWVREIAGGVHEGLVEGMVILGASKADYRQMRGQTFTQS